MESWRGSEFPLKMNPTIQNLKNSAHPPLAPSRFRYVAITVSCCFLSGLLQLGQSVILAPFILLQFCYISWLVPFRFCYISDFCFTCPLHSITGFVSLLLQLH